MSKHPVRVTGFTRFFIVMLLVAPLAYIAASYYNGEDGIANIKKILKLDKKETVASTTLETVNGTVKATEEPAAPAAQASKEEVMRLQEELDFKNKRIEELYRENEELKRKLESAEKALEESKKK